MDVREMQRPLKARYREDPSAASITLSADGANGDVPVSCSVEVGRAVHEAQAHAGVGGAGTAACSGDMLLGALAACAQVTCQMVAANMGIVTRSIKVKVEGDLDLRGTLGIGDSVPIGFQSIRLHFDIDAPGAEEEQLQSLRDKTLRYCVVLATLQSPPAIDVSWGDAPKTT